MSSNEERLTKLEVEHSNISDRITEQEELNKELPKLISSIIDPKLVTLKKDIKLILQESIHKELTSKDEFKEFKDTCSDKSKIVDKELKTVKVGLLTSLLVSFTALGQSLLDIIKAIFFIK